MDNALPHMLTGDALLAEKPPYSPPYIHKTDKGQRVFFQTWVWEEVRYKLTQYIIDDEETLQISKFPEETGFYQPIVIAKK